MALAVNANDIAGERVLGRLLALNNVVLDITPEFWHLLHWRLQVFLAKIRAGLSQLFIALLGRHQENAIATKCIRDVKSRTSQLGSLHDL